MSSGTRWFMLILLLWQSGSGAAEPRSPTVFEAEIRKFEALDQAVKPSVRPILLAGSSSFRMWTNAAAAFPGHEVVNRGFGGSTMADLLYFFDRVVLPVRPRAIFVYEGDNDLAQQKSPADVAAEYVTFLDRVEAQLPGTPVVLLAVKPSPSRRALLDAQRDLNARLQAFAKHRPNVFFADTFTPLLDAQGQPDVRFFKADLLHLNAAGYEAWQPAITAELAQLPPPRTVR